MTNPTLEALATQMRNLQEQQEKIGEEIKNVSEQILEIQPDPIQLKFDGGLTLAVRRGANRIDTRKVQKLHPADPAHPDNKDNLLYKLAVDTRKVRALLDDAALKQVTTQGATRVEVRQK